NQVVRVMSEVYPPTRQPQSIRTPVSRSSLGPAGPPCGSALEGPNCTSPPPGAPRCSISRDNACDTWTSVVPTASWANVAAIASSVIAIARRSRATSSGDRDHRSEEHTSELQSRGHLVCRLLLEKKKIRRA